VEGSSVPASAVPMPTQGPAPTTLALRLSGALKPAHKPAPTQDPSEASHTVALEVPTPPRPPTLQA
jgi:hypothetical protein